VHDGVYGPGHRDAEELAVSGPSIGKEVDMLVLSIVVIVLCYLPTVIDACVPERRRS
jgi:hypothetical protein